eukprot:jgi/Ulvmu1/11538/UM078_0028.1
MAFLDVWVTVRRCAGCDAESRSHPQHGVALVPLLHTLETGMARSKSALSGASTVCMLLAWFGCAWADEAAPAVQPPAEQMAEPCKFVSMSWKPQFGASHTVQASQVLPAKTVVSEDDSVVINVEATCDFSKVAYASVVFGAGDSPSSKVILMKQGRSSQHLKGQLKVADLKPLGGAFTVTIWVGDTKMRPMQWDVGHIGVLDRSGEHFLPAPPPTRHWAQFEVLRPLQHTFRPEQPSIPAIIPLIGSSVVAIPLLAFVYLLFFKLNANVSGMADSPFSLLFIAGITATLCLGVWYWMYMKLVDLFVPLAGLALFLLVVGHHALRRIADKRLASEKEAKAE